MSRKSGVRPAPEECDETLAELAPKNRRRRANVYDAVAGRISTNGFIPPVPFHSIYRDTASTNLNPVQPEEVLGRIKDFPTRFEEAGDFYFTNEDLPDSQNLPESDLLKAIHAYTSNQYTCTTSNKGLSDWRSLDETALIAMGILLEEAAQEALGETGDLMFVEGEEEEILTPAKTGRKRGKSAVDSISEGRAQRGLPRRRKRRRKTTNNTGGSGEER